MGAGVGVGVGASVRIARGPMRTPERSSSGPCGAGVGVGAVGGKSNDPRDCAATGDATRTVAIASTDADNAPALPTVWLLFEEDDGLRTRPFYRLQMWFA